MNPSSIAASHGFVGASQKICAIREKIDRIRQSRVPVLLLGESGTGKEVAARAIHNQNPRGEFVPIDCGSLVGPLMESELFGHLRGAFTGAHDNKRGLIEAANGGTAFFDEIGDLPLELQVKLLRLLQELEYRPVGSLIRKKVDIRVIAATHKDLRKAVEYKEFRHDLFYRLDVITLLMPALRDRKEDIPDLVESFLAIYPGYEMPAELLCDLVDYNWPGNVRELQNCIASVVAICPGRILRKEDLPLSIRSSPKRTESDLTALALFANGQKEIIPMSEVEKITILNALAQTKGDRHAAAEKLKIGRTTLYRKLKEYNLA